MATTLYLTTTASDLSPGGSNWDNEMSTSAPGATTLNVTIPNGDGNTGTYEETDYGLSATGVPSTDGSNTGTWTLEVVLTNVDSNINANPTISRINSSGTVQSGPIANAEGNQTMASSRTFTWSSPSLGTWAAGDRLRVNFQWSNESTHGGDETIDLTISSTGTRITTPWTLASTADPKLGALATMGIGK
jgi:hypothetical protein